MTRSARRWGSLGPLALAVAVAAGAGACTGSLGDPDGLSGGTESTGSGQGNGGPGGSTGGTGGGVGEGELPIETAPRLAFPRLSHQQWENSVADLFHLDAPTGLSSSFYPDPNASSTFDNNETSKQVTSELWADYQRAAETVAAMVAGTPDLLSRVNPAGNVDAATFIEALGRRAYRRPLTAAEVARFVELFEAAPALDVDGADTFVAGAKLTIEAMLQSPFFLYRVEIGGAPNADGDLPLSGWEIATKLSYTLWNTMPDDALFAAAAAGELDSPAGVATHVDRLLAGPAARQALGSFLDQVFDAEQYESVAKNPFTYPEWTDQHGADLREELRRFGDHVLFEQDGGLRDLLTSRTTFVNARLAGIYGLEGDFPTDDFVEVELDERRSGLLTLAGFLAWKGTDSDAPDTILRGVFINRRILCVDLPDPPDEAAGAKLGDENTNRQKVDALTGEGTCGAACHATFINPPGFAFEHFDSIGAWRDEDAGEPIDASSDFPFAEGETSYDGAVAFSELVADSVEAHECFAAHWVEFTFGRGLAEEDEGLVEHVAALSRDGASTKSVLRELLVSPAFLTRKPAEVQP